MTTKRFKKQHRQVAADMSLRAWAKYIAKGESESEFCAHAKTWMSRKGIAQ